MLLERGIGMEVIGGKSGSVCSVRVFHIVVAEEDDGGVAKVCGAGEWERGVGSFHQFGGPIWESRSPRLNTAALRALMISLCVQSFRR